MRKTILLTGFEPFGESNVNPSIIACKAIGKQEIDGFEIIVKEIPLRFREIKKHIERAIEETKPSIIICTGQSSRPVISLERVAINIADAKFIPYNCGKIPKGELLVPNRPDGYFSKFPLKKIEKRLEEEGIPCEISNTAGTFGCNEIFYYLMNYIEEKNEDILAGFVHVPSLPEQVVGKRFPSMSLEMIIKGLNIIINCLIDEEK